MQIYGLEFFVVCHHPYKSFDHKLCDSGDIMFLIRHMTSREHRFKGLCEFTGETPLTESHHIAIFGGHWCSAGGDKKHLNVI